MNDILDKDQAAEYALQLANTGIERLTMAAAQLAKSGANFHGEALAKELMHFRNSVLAQHRACREAVYTEFKNRQLLKSAGREE